MTQRTPPFLRPQAVGKIDHADGCECVICKSEQAVLDAIDQALTLATIKGRRQAEDDLALAGERRPLRDRRRDLQDMADELAEVVEMLAQCRKAGRPPRSVDVQRAALIQHRLAKLVAE